MLKFSVRNTKSNENDNTYLGNSDGVGLTNLKRRLELTYCNNYDLNILEENRTYLAELIIYQKDNHHDV